MDDQHNAVHHSQPHASPFQFSLRTMFILTTVVAILCSGLFASPHWGRLLTLFCWLLASPAVLTAVVIYGRGYLRTFAIGGLFAAGPTAVYSLLLWYAVGEAMIDNNWESVFQPNDSVYGEGIFVAVQSTATILLGLLVMGVRWMVERGQSSQEKPKPHSVFELP